MVITVGFMESDGVHTFKGMEVIPPTHIPQVLENFHAIHQGASNMFAWAMNQYGEQACQRTRVTLE